MAQRRYDYGIVLGERPPQMHRLSAMSGRAQCGKYIVIIPRKPDDRQVCEGCARFDAADGL